MSHFRYILSSLLLLALMLSGCTSRPLGTSIANIDPSSPPKTVQFPQRISQATLTQGGIVVALQEDKTSNFINAHTSKEMVAGNYTLLYDLPYPVFRNDAQSPLYIIGTDAEGRQNWKTTLPKSYIQSILLPDNNIINISTHDKGLMLSVLNVVNGEELWSKGINSAVPGSATKWFYVLHEDHVGFLIEGTLYNVSLKNGTLQTQVKLKGFDPGQFVYIQPIQDMDVVVNGTNLYVVAPKELSHKIPLKGPANAVYQVQRIKDRVLIQYAYSDQGQTQMDLMAVGIGSGKTLWSLNNLEKMNNWVRRFVVSDDDVYYDYDKELYVVSLQDGRLKRTHDLSLNYLKYSNKFLHKNAIIFYSDDYLASIDSKTGQTNWEHDLYTQSKALRTQQVWGGALMAATQSLNASINGVNEMSYASKSHATKDYYATNVALSISNLSLVLNNSLASISKTTSAKLPDYLLYHTAPEMVMGYNNFLKPIPTLIDLESGNIAYFDGIETNTQTARGNATTNMNLARTMVWYSQASLYPSDRLKEIDIYTLPKAFMKSVKNN